MRYHVNKTTGLVGRCRATQRCPFGDLQEDHYGTREGAEKAFEKMMAEKVIVPPVVKSALKEMDANDLAHDLLSRVEGLGGPREEFSDVLELSSLLHAGQYRRNRGRHTRTPYIEHPLRATLRLMNWGVTDVPTLKAALLHDTVEDCAKTFVEDVLGKPYTGEEAARQELADYIGRSSGEDTRMIVLGVTNEHTPKEEAAERTLEEKHAVYRNNLRVKIKKSPKILVVKLSDFKDNAGSLHHTDLPGNEVKTKRQAMKYLPCVPYFKEEVSKSSDFLAEETIQEILADLEAIEKRLEGLVEKYQHI